MRTGTEARNFFVVGKVFAMLYTEAAGGYQAQLLNDAYTTVRFNERVHTNIRRFVVVEDKHGFVYACGIGTYSGRGTLKSGINPAEHAIVYLSGTDPESCYLPGEREAGMTREPIEVVPVDSSVRIRPESRIRFGKTYPIEKNVKVKDIGIVHPSHTYKLVAYWQDRDDYGGSSSYLRSTPNYAISEPTQVPDPDSDSEDVLLLRRDAEHHLSAVALNSRLTGDLSSDYQVVQNPRGFFKKGVVFMVPWPEPGGDFVKDRVGPPVVVKIRRFVVIRPKNTFCLCLPIHTYGGQATTKPGINPQDHAAVIAENDDVDYRLPNEAKLDKTPLRIKVENASTGPIDRASRINFAKIYTVEYNVKVWKVGRIVSDSVWRMEQYFTECSRIGNS
jgi:hypothetical protein